MDESKYAWEFETYVVFLHSDKVVVMVKHSNVLPECICGNRKCTCGYKHFDHKYHAYEDVAKQPGMKTAKIVKRLDSSAPKVEWFCNISPFIY